MIGPALALSLALLAPPTKAMCLTDHGKVAVCSDIVGVPLCWDTRQRAVVPCDALPQDTDGAINRSVRAIVGKGIDLTTTAIAINAGAVETNRHTPTVEHRIGFGLIAIGGQIAIQEGVAKRSPKWATRLSRAMLLGYAAVGVHNLIQADHARKAAGQ